jgi:hypothetical protein
MKVVCAHCQAEGRSGLLGEVAPLEDAAVIDGICQEHRLQVDAESDAAAAHEGDQVGGRAYRRRFERVPVALPVMGRAPQFPGIALRGMARYVGAGGMMVEFPVEVVQGTVLQVIFSTPRGPLEMEGEIVWTSSHGGVIRHGLAFPEPKDLAFVELVVGEHQSGGD